MKNSCGSCKHMRAVDGKQNRHVLKPGTTGTKPPEQPERNHRNNRNETTGTTGTTGTRIGKDRNHRNQNRTGNSTSLTFRLVFPARFYEFTLS